MALYPSRVRSNDVLGLIGAYDDEYAAYLRCAELFQQLSISVASKVSTLIVSRLRGALVRVVDSRHWDLFASASDKRANVASLDLTNAPNGMSAPTVIPGQEARGRIVGRRGHKARQKEGEQYDAAHG
jgi:hypothetical protein